MKSMWKKVLAALCAAAMLMTAPGICVLADEIEQEEIIVSEAEQIPEEAWAADDSEKIPVEGSANAAEPAEIPEEAAADVSIPAEEPADTVQEDSSEGLVDTQDFVEEELVGATPTPTREDAFVFMKNCRHIQVSSSRGNQCVELYNQYLEKVFGEKPYLVKYAYQIYDQSFPSGWTKIPAGSIKEYKVGDIVVYNAGNGTDVGSAGHVALVYSVDNGNVKLLEQNWAGVKTAELYNLHTARLKGIIRPKFASTQTGTEMTSGYNAVLPNGDYQIVCYSNTNYYLDIEGGASVTNGTNVKIFGPLMNLNSYDVWTITYSNGFYKIKQKGANMCLDLKDGNKASGTNVQAYVDDGTKAQQWAISKYSDGKGYKVQAKCSGYCLDVLDGKMDKNVNVQVYPSNNTNAQRWLFIPYQPQKTIADGRYILVSALDPNIVLDITGDTADVADGTNVRIWTDNAKNRYNSIDVTYIDKGYYRLAHAASGKSVEIKDSSLITRGNIQLSTSKDARNQWWFIMKQGTGYRIVSRLNGLVIDVAGRETAAGTNVQQYYHNAADSQIWKFVKAEYKVKYNANGGSGAPSTQTKYYRNALTLSSAKPTRSGYDFLGWAASSTASSAAYKSGGSYTADKDITLYAVWKQQATPEVHLFSDVQDPSHPFYNAIYWATDEGITKGYPDGTFGTDRDCTRGEMMMFLWRYVGQPAPKAASKSPFPDVPTTHAFYNAILWGSQKGITKGYPDGTFGINRNVSRGESMMFLWRLKGKPAPAAASVSPFKDVPTNHAFYNAILWGSQNGVTKGYTSGDKKGTFGINENCSRGAIVTFLYRAKLLSLESQVIGGGTVYTITLN